MRTPYPHQSKMISYLKENQNAALLVEMRLGKTHAIISAYNEAGPVLVVCPKSVLPVWKSEFEADGIRSVQFASSGNLASLRRSTQWTVVNYEAAMRMSESFLEYFRVVVLDEAVRIKNPKAKVSRFFVQNFRNARRCIASGNVAPESPLEYFTPMQFLYDRWMGCSNYWQFRNVYFASDVRGWSWWPKSKDVKERIKKSVEDSSYILTRKKVGLANQKIYQQRYVELPKPVQKIYDKMEKDFAMTLPSGKEIEVAHTVAQVSYLAQVAGGGTKDEELADHKIKELLELLTGELAREKVVVWFRFNFELQRAMLALYKKGIHVQYLTGECSVGKREAVMSLFKDAHCRVLLIQVKVGLYGLNLSQASTAIYFSNPLSGNERTQSEDRIEHNDKKEPLLYIDLLSKGTIDEDVYKALKTKHRQSRYFLGEVVENMRHRRGMTQRFVIGKPKEEAYACADFR